MSDICTWEYDDDERSCAWETSCGNMFCFIDEGPRENNFGFCPYCGGSLVIKEPSHD